MKNKGLGLAIASLLLLSACGSGEGDSGSEAEGGSQNNSSADSEEAQGDSPEAESTPKESDGSDEASGEASAGGGWDTQVGEQVENEGGTFTLHARQDDIDTIETGPITLDIEQVNAASGELSAEMQSMMETENIDYVQIDLSVENTGEDDTTFYASQATIATSTGEQLESDLWLSDHIAGDLMSGTSHSGSFYFVLENSKAEDVESVRVTWSAPVNANYEEVGDAVDIEVEL